MNKDKRGETAMARLGVTKEDVFKACEALVSTGVPITVANVRHELGTGSYTTILPLIQEFKVQASAEKTPEVAGSPTLPESVTRQGRDLMEQIWANAWDMACKEIEKAKAEFEANLQAKSEELSGVNAELSQTIADLKRYEAEISGIKQELETEKAARQKQQGEMDLLRQQAAARESENKATLERAITTEKELAKAKAEFTAILQAKDKELTHLAAELSRVRSDLDQQMQESQTSRREFDAEKAKWQKREGEMEILQSQIAANKNENRSLLERAIRAEKELELKTKAQ